ncbi:MAG TPA: thermonuclease family protein [Coleofasciculaceae cyanobacterium]|jgi:endonuclease YncB( thermonuclease family)
MTLKPFLLLAFVLLNSSLALVERVISVHDGDTLTIEDGQRIRLYGIDAPELSQPLGKTARDYLKAQVLNHSITLECRDQSYKRQICVVWRDMEDMAQAMVRQGWAFDYKHYFHDCYLNDPDHAKAEQLGVWQLPDGGERPWVYHHRLRHKLRVLWDSIWSWKGVG